MSKPTSPTHAALQITVENNGYIVTVRPYDPLCPQCATDRWVFPDFNKLVDGLGRLLAEPQELK